MFDQVGKKLQVLAKIVFWIGIAGPLTALIAIIVGTDLVVEFLAIGIGTFVFFMIGAWALYAFGQITEDVHALREALVNNSKTETKE